MNWLKRRKLERQLYNLKLQIARHEAEITVLRTELQLKWDELREVKWDEFQEVE